MWHCFFFCYFRIKFYLFLNGTAPVHVWETETASVWLVSYNSFVTFISRIYHLDPLFDSVHENGSYIQTMQKCRMKMLEEFSLLFSLSTCTMIGQFSEPLFPRYGQINSKISMNSNLPPLTELRDVINIAYYPRFFRDRGSSDDCIGTAFINLSSIAGQGGDEGKAKYTMRMIRLNRSKCYSDFIVFALNIF